MKEGDNHGVGKALIINTRTNAQISVMFNPAEYSLDKTNSFSEIGIPGLSTPPIQYVRGNARALKMELFFDTYEDEIDKDVRRFTRQITALLEPETETKAPPILLFSWGPLSFQCVLDSVSQRFTMFLSDGRPVRATLTVSFKEFQPADIELSLNLFGGPPVVHIFREGDTLSGLAERYLGDSARWREIADRNNIADPQRIAPITPLVIPSKG